MTGEKDRYTTTEKLWNLDDKTLSTPAHDEMVLWLLNKNNIRNLVPEFKDTELEIASEDPLTAENGFLVGYLDIVIKYADGDSPGFKYIEVKPTISSFGTTLRQLNTYIHYLSLRRAHPFKRMIDFNLFTTDLRFKDAFESQGINVLTYPKL